MKNLKTEKYYNMYVVIRLDLYYFKIFIITIKFNKYTAQCYNFNWQTIFYDLIRRLN